MNGQAARARVSEEAINAADHLKRNIGNDLHLRPQPLIAQYFPRTIPVLTSGGDPMVARRLA